MRDGPYIQVNEMMRAGAVALLCCALSVQLHSTTL